MVVWSVDRDLVYCIETKLPSRNGDEQDIMLDPGSVPKVVLVETSRV